MSQPTLGTSAFNPSAVLAQVDQLRQAGRLADAEHICRLLVEQQPNLPNALNVLGLLVRMRGDYAEAESLMRRAIAAAPREAALYNNLGNILMAAEKPVEAESAYRKAVEMRSDYPEAWYNLGLALRALAKPDQALVAFRRAVTQRPGYPQADVQIGVILSERGESQDALRHLERAAIAAPTFYDAQYYRGVALMDLERFEEAIPVLQSAVDIAPRRHEARFAVSKCFAQVGREADALLGYQTAFEAKPDFLPALQEFTGLAWSLGNGQQSLAGFSYARSKVGDTPDLLLAEADFRLRLLDTVAAEAMLRKAANLAPERADIANALARALTAEGRFDEGFPLFEKAIAAEPEALRHRRDYGEALLKSGDTGEARRRFREVLAQSPYDQIALGCLSLAERELGDSDYERLVDHARFVREFEIAPPAGFTNTAAFNRALAIELERLHTRRAPPIDQTLRNGTQTTGSLFAQRTRAIEAVRDQIRAAVAAYIKELPDDPAHPFLARKNDDFAFSGSWSCRLNAAGYHTNHVHNEGWISSAYYVSLPEAVAAGEGGQGALTFGASRFELGERDRPAKTVQPAVGKLVLFPSYFWHGTVPFQSDHMRLTVAFDVTPGAPVRRALYQTSY